MSVSLLWVSVFESLKAQQMWRRRTIFQKVDISRDTTLSNWISLCAQIVAPIRNILEYLYFLFSHVTCQVSPVMCHVFWKQRSQRSYLSATLLSSPLQISLSSLLVLIFKSLKAHKMWRRKTLFQKVDVLRDRTLSNCCFQSSELFHGHWFYGLQLQWRVKPDCLAIHLSRSAAASTRKYIN